MLFLVPSRRCRLAVCTRMRPHVAASATMAIAVALAACIHVTVVRSLAPAIDDAAAIDVPGFVGSWANDDTRWDVTRDSGAVPAYIIAVSAVAANDSAGEASPTLQAHVEARIGEVADILLLEMRPALRGDSALQLVDSLYPFQIERAYLVQKLRIHGDRLLLSWFTTDSVEAAVRDGRCATPFFPDTVRGIVLTGTSAEVRATWACAARQRGFFQDATEFERVKPRAVTAVGERRGNEAP